MAIMWQKKKTKHEKKERDEATITLNLRIFFSCFSFASSWNDEKKKPQTSFSSCIDARSVDAHKQTLKNKKYYAKT